MDLYIGTKTILAKEMTFEAYNKKRGWDLPDIDNRAEVGFLVEDLDTEDPDQSDRKGYVSWLPKAVFNRLYQNVEEGMSFGRALVFLESGHKITRKGWGKEFGNITVSCFEDFNHLLESHDMKAKDWVLVK